MRRTNNRGNDVTIKANEWLAYIYRNVKNGPVRFSLDRSRKEFMFGGSFMHAIKELGFLNKEGNNRWYWAIDRPPTIEDAEKLHKCAMEYAALFPAKKKNKIKNDYDYLENIIPKNDNSTELIINNLERKLELLKRKLELENIQKNYKDEISQIERELQILE